MIQELLEEVSQKAAAIPANATQKVKALIEEYKALKERAEKYRYLNGAVIIEDGDFIYKLHVSLFDGFTAEVIGFNGLAYVDYIDDDIIINLPENGIDIPAFADGIPVTKIGNMNNYTAPGILDAITTLNVPATVKSLSNYDLWALSSLENINVDEENPYFQSVDGVVFDKSGQKLVLVPNARTEYTVPRGTRSIGEYAFYGSQIQSVTFFSGEDAKWDEMIPESDFVSVIGEFAFANCYDLEEIDLSDVKTIGEYAFARCENLKKVIATSTTQKVYENAFLDVSEDFVIECASEWDYMAKYAKENNIKYTAPLEADIDIDFQGDFFGTVSLGSTVTFTGKAVGGEGDYLYAFLYRKEGDTKWTVKQGYKENNTWDFTAAYTGNYEFCVKVKDSSGEIYKTFTELDFVESFVNESSISADTIKKGETVTVTAVPEEGMENCTYAFYYKKVSDTKWTQKQGFDTNDTVEIKPAYATDYQVCVKIKDENGNISKKYFDLTVQPK